jgi:hypothetical protein
MRRVDRPPEGHSDQGSIAVVAALAAAVALAAATAPTRHRPDANELGVRRSATGTHLATRSVAFTFEPGTGKLRVTTDKSESEKTTRDLALSLVVDGDARPLTISRFETRATHKDSFGAALSLDAGEDHYGAVFDLRVEQPTEALIVALSVRPRAPPMQKHTFALRVDVPTGGKPAFASGTGEISDLSTVNGPMAVVDDEPRPIGVTSLAGPLELTLAADDGATPTLSATSAPANVDAEQPGPTDLRIVIGAAGSRVWGALHHSIGEPTARVAGVVTGTRERAQVFGLDSKGAMRVRVLTEQGGRFDVEVPSSVTQWYAALDPARTSAPILFPPGTGYDLRLDVSPGGELRVKVTDADTGLPLTARLVVHGVEGTLDPSFGPDYRASGAGPIIDALRGEVATPLPAGKYRVAATKGIEWSVDARTIEIVGGHSVAVDLTPRHVLKTPGVVGCDLHVHARPSFDTPVSPEDRVLSLVAAGVDFAIPSEHNLVGDYAPMLDALGLSKELAWIPGVEVTTYSPRLGHFGIFPFLPGPVPPFRHSSIGAVFNAAHRGDPSRVLQVNHPRLTTGIGYFELVGFEPNKAPPARMRTDFDTLEVYNGYDAPRPDRIDLVLRDWYALLNMGYRYAATGSSDSHRIQYQWAGYPRTLVDVGEAAAGETGLSIDGAAIVAAVKKGHSIITTGPVIELDAEGAHPGDELATAHEPIKVHVVVRAAPWVDVSSLEIVVGGRTVSTDDIASRPLTLGPEAGTPEEAAARTLRYDATLDVPVGPATTWLIVIARGERAMDDILPFMPVPPLAFTNPVWILRPGSPWPMPPRRR